MTDSLSKLFGSQARLKLLRLFLFNPKLYFTVSAISMHSRVGVGEVKQEMAVLYAADVVKRIRNARGIRYILNEEFSFLGPLQNLLLNAPARGEEIYSLIKMTGVIKLVVLGGFFVGDEEGPVDLLVVGDRFKDKQLKDKIRVLESEIGKEIRFSYLSTPDFFYRMNVSDRLVRDMFDYPHKVVFDKLDIGLK